MPTPAGGKTVRPGIAAALRLRSSGSRPELSAVLRGVRRVGMSDRMVLGLVSVAHLPCGFSCSKIVGYGRDNYHPL